MSKIPDEWAKAATGILEEYLNSEDESEIAVTMLEAAAPGIRAAYMNDCVNEFLNVAAQTEIPADLANGLAEVFRSFAAREEERGKRVAQAHGRTVGE